MAVIGLCVKFKSNTVSSLCFQERFNGLIPGGIWLKDNAVMIRSRIVKPFGIGDFFDHPFDNIFRQQKIVLAKKTVWG